jgi:glycosyltransferase involved in cell wall biosynthesis
LTAVLISAFQISVFQLYKNMPRISEQISCENPKVSVHMITYNHEKFIAQAIESVLVQKTNFPIELVIGEDCSTDGTRAIVKRYADARPDIIRAFFRERNVGMKENNLEVFAACRGEYIALLEGDDYWTSPHKLQRQVAVLENCSNSAFCFHNTSVVFEEDPSQNHLSSPSPPSEVAISDILQRWFIMTSSIVLRKSYLLPLPPWSVEINNGDYMSQMLLAARGSVHYIDEVMSVYRRHTGGISKMFDDPRVYVENIVRLYSHFNRWSGGKYREPISRGLAALYFGSAMSQRARGAYIWFGHDALLHLRFMIPISLMGAANSMRHFVLPRSWNVFLQGTRPIKRIKEMFHSDRDRRSRLQ